MSAVRLPERGIRDEIAEDVDRLIGLIEASRVDEARSLAGLLTAKWPDSLPIRNLHRVLQPPEVISTDGAPRPSLEQEWAWLREHAHEYPGCWLAVRGDRLLAVGPDRTSVAAAAREALGSEGALLFFQPIASR